MVVRNAAKMRNFIGTAAKQYENARGMCKSAKMQMRENAKVRRTLFNL